jgi:hypothetical protein
MNNINDGHVAAGLAPNVVQNATLVTVLGVVKHLAPPPDAQTRQAQIE